MPLYDQSKMFRTDNWKVELCFAFPVARPHKSAVTHSCPPPWYHMTHLFRSLRYLIWIYLYFAGFQGNPRVTRAIYADRDWIRFKRFRYTEISINTEGVVPFSSSSISHTPMQRSQLAADIFAIMIRFFLPTHVRRAGLRNRSILWNFTDETFIL